MARDPETIEREIEQARDALAATLDELGERANPKRLVESSRATVQQRLACTARSRRLAGGSPGNMHRR